MKARHANYIHQAWSTVENKWKDSTYHKTAKGAIMEASRFIPQLTVDRRVVEAGSMVQIAYFASLDRIKADRREALS